MTRLVQSDLPLTLPGDTKAFAFAAARRSLRQRASAREPEDQISFARSVTATVTLKYWNIVCEDAGRPFPIRLSPVPTAEVGDSSIDDYAHASARLDATEAFFHIGELYTALLPSDYRTRHGIYYTPPRIVGRLLDVLESHGADWATARVLDPACGGAAFVACVAQRMLRANASYPTEDRLRDLGERLVGFDVDPFATWLSAVLLDVVCLPLLRKANRRIDGVIRTGDTLSCAPEKLGHFDVVLGNPPYGKISLAPAQRQRFSRSLFGHANLYGVFTDFAIAATRPGGLVGFVTPTSFLGGEYFKKLRALMLDEAMPVHASFVSDRHGVFSDVLQETVLTVTRRAPLQRPKSRPPVRVAVELVTPDPDGEVAVLPLGSTSLPGEGGAPWILPRSRSQVALVRKLSRMKSRLSDYGYTVATGQLVWNRHKPQFRDQPGKDRYPVLWAECIHTDGTFEFRALKRNHRPFIEVARDQSFLINEEPCVLVQRTTSTEQSRRLVAAIIPNSFVTAHPGYAVENHVNMVVPATTQPSIPLQLLAQLLNSSTVDEAFRCISGSVAVSAYELESLPLPEPADLLAGVQESKRLRPARSIETIVHSLYYDE